MIFKIANNISKPFWVLQLSNFWYDVNITEALGLYVLGLISSNFIVLFD